jgi:hypothetical protein
MNQKIEGWNVCDKKLKQKLRNGQKLKFGSCKIALKVWWGDNFFSFKSLSKVILQNKQNIKDNSLTKV